MESATDSYTEHPAAAGGADVLVCTWSRTTAVGSRTYRIVPDGCVDLVWTGARLFVAGPDTHAQLTTAEPGTMVGVRFRPGGAAALLGGPASAIRDERPSWAEIAPDASAQAFAHRIADQLSAAAASPSAMEALLVRAVLGELRRDRLDPAMAAVVAGLRAGIPVGQLAGRLGLAERALHRRSVAAFGYGPKMLHRVLRFQRALRLVRSGRSFVDAAIETGYADQPHLAREVRALAGVPLGVLVSR